MNLTFRQLQVFVEVIRSGSVSEAARTLGRTQPSVSAMITSLENEIGFSLFLREKKRLTPRPEAHYFFEEAEHMLERLSQSARTLQEIGNLQKGVLRIACNPAASQFFFPDLLAEFLKGRPEVEASLIMRSSDVVAESIASQQYDLGFGESLEPRQSILAENFSFPCLCGVPASSALSRKDHVTATDLSGLPMAMLYEEHSISRRLRAVFEIADAQLNKRFEFRTYSPALMMVSKGLGVVVCDSFSALSHQMNFGQNSHIVFRPFIPTIYLEMSLMTPANRPLSLLAKTLFDTVSGELERYLTYKGTEGNR